MGEKRLKTDRRVIKTRKAIRNAFIKLLAKKDFDRITVKDIADMADVDRKTVYNYYNGVYDIRNEVENELAELLEAAVREIDFDNNIKNPLRIFEILTENINSNLELYGYLMQLDANSYIIRKIYNVMRDKVCAAIARVGIPHYDMCASFITSGILVVYQNWFNSGRTKDLETLSQEVGQLVVYGLASFKSTEKTSPDADL